MSDAAAPAGKPLAGLKVVEIASIGPGPFAAMMLADHGAEIIRLDRPGGANTGVSHKSKDPLLRGRPTLELNLKDLDNVQSALKLIDRADILIEGYRPGVMERLGLGPETCQARNPALVYGRMTGWGQEGPLAHAAGHDINYIALTGALDAVGTATSGPVPALNLIGDFGGGGMLLAFGVISAVFQAKLSGKGSIVDAAMVDGAALLMAMPFGLKAAGLWPGGREQNLLDGGAPFYGTYKTNDDKWVAIGSIEPPFWQQLCELLDLDAPIFANRMDRTYWPQLKALIGEKIATKTRDEWVVILEGTDVCFAPVLTMDEAPGHPHLAARSTLQMVNGIVQPAPAPRFDGITPVVPEADDTVLTIEEAIARWG